MTEQSKLTPEQVQEQRTKILDSAKKTSDIATDLITRHNQWLWEADAAFPAPYSFDKRTRTKNKTFHALFNRVCSGVSAYKVNKQRFEDEDRRAAEAAKKAKQAAQNTEFANARLAEHTRLRTAAVAWLLAKGKALGVDFDVDNALDVANNLAADLWLASVPEGNHAFCGSDYCENCSGWDGKSRRCNCGNRRVYWERNDYHTFEEPSFTAMAH